MRPDAYIFDDGLHFEVRTVQEEDEMLHSRETINEQSQKQMNVRKLSSVMSEDSDIFAQGKLFVPTPEIVESITSPKLKSPFLSIVRQTTTTTSTESKDTLTPVEAVEDHTLVENEEEGSTENIMELNFESARQRALRRRSMGRRCSEQHCSNYDLNRSQTSLNATGGMCRRQLSLTQSEPDSGNDGNLLVLHNTIFQLHLQFKC